MTDADADLSDQLSALERRVAASGLYTHEPSEFRVAVAAYRVVSERLGVVEDRGTLTTAESRNIVRRVRLHDGSEACLKVVGNTREPGEGEVLEAWHALGLPCVEPLAWGYEGRGSYLLTRFVDAPTLPRTFEGPVEARVDVASRLIALMRRFHDAPVRVSRARTWEQRMRTHLHWTLPLLRERGVQEPPGWEARLAELSAQGRCILHGDPAGGNVLQGPDGLILLDPPGALRGLREADAAQICSQIGGAEHAEELIDAVCAHHRWLEPGGVAALAGVNFLTWAGYALAGHENPDAAAGSLDVARRLLA
jgi:hypothetical protein